MALTFKISDGDVEFNTSTGRPKLIGNEIGENVLSKSKEKARQDLQGALSIDRINSGAGAGISELVGLVKQTGFASTKVLLQRQINNMFRSLVRLQNRRPNIRTDNERFSSITLFRIIEQPATGVKTAYKFRLDVVTVGRGSIIQSGTITG